MGTAVLKNLNDAKSKALLLEKLAAFGDGNFSADQGIAYHIDPPNKISLPEGMTPAQGAKALTEVSHALAQEEAFTRTFRYRPWDGAHAVVQVMSRFFGTTGRGVPIQTMFGSIPPRQIEIETGPNETAQVAWGHVEFAAFDGKLMFDSAFDSEYGQLFQLTVYCPKRHGKSVTGFFNLIQMELENNSIYKGKSIKNAHDVPRFLDLSDDDTIVYSDEVTAGLTNTVWGVIEKAALFRRDGRKIAKRVLMYGPYGTGKSEAGKKTAKIANDNGWTFLSFHSGKGTLDELEATMATARLYAPSIVFIEDIDIYASKMNEEYQTRLSNLFDGVNTKDAEVMILMTSNHPAEFSKAMTRAGRVDRMIEVGSLDKHATETLIRRVIGEDRLDNVDFDRVWEAMEDFEPSFVRQTFDQAAEAAIIRSDTLEYQLTTQDLVAAANLMRPQHDQHRNKDDSRKVMTLDMLFEEKIMTVMSRRIQGHIDMEEDLLTYSVLPQG
jgi:hypothetical protein